MTDEWWPELGPKWEQSAVTKPPCLCVDVHTHLAVPAGVELARPHFKPEMDPRTFFSPEVKVGSVDFSKAACCDGVRGPFCAEAAALRSCSFFLSSRILVRHSDLM